MSKLDLLSSDLMAMLQDLPISPTTQLVPFQTDTTEMFTFLDHKAIIDAVKYIELDYCHCSEFVWFCLVR